MENPLHHFEVHNIIPIHIGGLDLSISNAVVAMWVGLAIIGSMFVFPANRGLSLVPGKLQSVLEIAMEFIRNICLLYTSPSPRDATLSRMPSSA